MALTKIKDFLFTIIFSLIRQILQREPSDRIRIERIMDHAWFNDISPEERFSPAKIQQFNPHLLTKSKVKFEG